MSIKDRLYDKMSEEFDRMIEEMKGLPPDKIIDKAYEKVTKEDLLACFNSEKGFSDEEIQALYNLEYPLETLYQRWQDTDVSYSDLLRDSVDDSVQELLSDIDKEQILLEMETEGLILSDLLSFNLEDIHLCHNDEEHDLATVVELNNETLTATGRQDWADVLNAKVEQVYTGEYGLQIALSGVSVQRLTDFSYMLAGHVPLSDYNRWVNESEEPESEIVTPQKNPIPSTKVLNGELLPGDWVDKKERLQGELMERINKNYSDYLESLQDFGNTGLVGMAGKIAAMSDAYSYMTDGHNFDNEELEFYLQFQNPLEVVADVRCDFNINLDDMSFVLNHINDRREEFLSDYPLMGDADTPLDTSLRRFMGVNLNDFLGKIAEKTIIHYPNDWSIDAKELSRAAMSTDPNEKRLVWHVCSVSTHLKPEREVFIKDTGDYQYMTDYHQNDPDMFGYFVEVTGMDGKDFIGNVFEVGNYADFAKHIRNVAEPLESITLLYNDGSTKNLPITQYDNDRAKYNKEKGYPLPEIVYHPQDKTRLAGLLVSERAKRMSYPIGSTGAHLRKMADILKEVRKPPEQAVTKPKKSLEEKMKAAQEKANAFNAQKGDTKKSVKKKETDLS